MTVKVMQWRPGDPISDQNGLPTKQFHEFLVSLTRRGLSDLPDVDVGGLANGETVIYNSTSKKWENGAN